VIADLEHALGVRLLDRSPKGVEPTVYGHALLKRGLAAFDELRQGIRDIEFLADPASGEVRIGCASSPADQPLVPVVERLMVEDCRDEYRRLVLHVDAILTPQLFPGLHDRKYDLYITLLPLPERRVPEDLDIELLFSDPLVVAVGKHHRWANRRKVAFSELVN